MNSGKFMLPIWTMWFILLFPNVLAADSTDAGPGKTQTSYQMGIEYLYPTEDDRDIRTVNLNAYRRFAEFRRLRLSIHVGLTVTFATGEITQLEGDVNKGTLHEVRYDSRAAGIGPALLLDTRLLGKRRLTFHLEGSGAVLLYSKKFPAGGDPYNFMWRGGAVLKYDMGHNRTIGLGYQWMHVSNGQGVGAQNPSYEAEGVCVDYSFLF